ncbi:ankyrin repeat domain-containing protein 26-like isoform X4 [Ochotona princeps]|uniref:ankyrin repeat domain-containing protein 26-like isoform X4 n=1 Tax=Ochotona princeps TaxID=9978 RepID=UPI002715175F|nr:ankyrin repeat domain-containing protein 26-like isoform X4 [Ochotona princeps]
MTQRLLKSQFEYHARDKKLGKIHRAASKGDVLTIHHLLEVQASGVNDRDRSNRTALHLACAKGHVEVVNFLIGRQCLIDAIDNADMTPLMKDDLTPLLVAICAKRENTVDFLVKNNDIFHALDNMDRFCNKFGHVDHLIAPGVEDFNLFTMKEPSTSSDVKNKNDTAGIQSAKKEQANKDGINCTDEFCNYTNAVSTLRVEEKIVESSSDSKSISQSPLQKNDDQAGTAEEREMCRNQPLTNSNKKEKAPWAMSKQSFHRSFRTSKHNTVVPELEHVSSPTHNDTELTIKKGQTLLERTECIQPQEGAILAKFRQRTSWTEKITDHGIMILLLMTKNGHNA